MRGLPPVPAGVLELEQVFQFGFTDFPSPRVVGGHYTSTFRLWAPLLGTLEVPTRTELLNQLSFGFVRLASAVTTQHCFMTEHRYRYHGPAFFDYVFPLSDANGEWDGTAYANVATGIYWRTPLPRRRGHAISYFPTFPDDWTDDGARVNNNGFAGVRAAALRFFDDIIEVEAAYGQTLTPCLVRRVERGAPLAHALVDFIERGQPCERVCDMGRRLPGRARLTHS